jgi:hypothetical protein
LLVGRHVDAVFNFHPYLKGTRLWWVALEHGIFLAAVIVRRGVEPRHRIRRHIDMVSFVARRLGGADHESTNEAYGQSHIRYPFGDLHRLTPLT